MTDEKKDQARENAETTERIVLRQVHATVAVDEPGEDYSALVWVPVEFEMDGSPTVYRGTKAQCIDQAAGDTPGDYKAISLRSWKGTRTIEIPENPSPVRAWSDD